jgi:hypothetical protein
MFSLGSFSLIIFLIVLLSWMSNGVPIETVGKMLAHRNLKTTQHYEAFGDKLRNSVPNANQPFLKLN